MSLMVLPLEEKCLASANEIYGLDIIAPEKEGVVKTYSWDDLGEGVQEVQGSRVQGKIPDIDAIIHLAGKAHDTNYTIVGREG